MQTASRQEQKLVSLLDEFQKNYKRLESKTDLISKELADKNEIIIKHKEEIA